MLAVAQLPRLSTRWLPAAGRPPEMCGLRTRLRTDADPPRVELPSAGGRHYRLGRYLVVSDFVHACIVILAWFIVCVARRTRRSYFHRHLSVCLDSLTHKLTDRSSRTLRNGRELIAFWKVRATVRVVKLCVGGVHSAECFLVCTGGFTAGTWTGKGGAALPSSSSVGVA